MVIKRENSEGDFNTYLKMEYVWKNSTWRKLQHKCLQSQKQPIHTLNLQEDQDSKGLGCNKSYKMLGIDNRGIP